MEAAVVAARDAAPAATPQPYAASWATPETIGSVCAAVGLSALLQMRFGAIGDVSWMLTIGEKWLGGATPYVDFVETNPPASIAIYLPSLLLSHAFGLRAEAAVVFTGLVAGLGALAYAAAMLRRGGVSVGAGPVPAAVAAFALFLLPGRAFGERDHWLAFALAPCAALWMVRTAGARPRAVDVGAVGLLLGLACAVKPTTGAVALVVLPYLWRRLGFAALMRCAEFWVAGGFVAFYAAGVVAFFPAYVSDVAPTLALAYLPVREPFAALLANAGTVSAVTLVGLSAYLNRERLSDCRVAVPALVAAGGLAAYLIQGKGWLYQALPAVIAAATLAGLTLASRNLSPKRLALALIACAGVWWLGAMAVAPPLALAVLFGVLVHFLSARRGQPTEATMEGLAEGLLAALLGAVAAFYSLPIPGASETFKSELAAIAPHPRIAAIAPGLGTGFPVTRQVDGVWIMRRQGQLMTAGARALLSRGAGDPAALGKVIAQDRDALVADIVRERPDAILVGRINPAFLAATLADPAVSAALAPYRRIAANDDPLWPVDLYARADFVGLRGPQ